MNVSLLPHPKLFSGKFSPRHNILIWGVSQTNVLYFARINVDSTRIGGGTTAPSRTPMGVANGGNNNHGNDHHSRENDLALVRFPMSPC